VIKDSDHDGDGPVYLVLACPDLATAERVELLLLEHGPDGVQILDEDDLETAPRSTTAEGSA